MSKDLDALKLRIVRNIKYLIDSGIFKEWIKSQTTKEGDYLVLNNSFIYRKPLVKTSKNEQYLCVKMKKGKPQSSEPFVGNFADFDSDFKIFSAKSSNLPSTQPLNLALKTELTHVGRLLFVIIGELEDSAAEVSLNHAYARILKFEPTSSHPVVKADENGNKIIVIDQLTDPGKAWNSIEAVAKAELGNDLSSLETAFETAFDRLKDQARSKLTLPEKTTPKRESSFIGKLHYSVSRQAKMYSDALKELESSGTRTGGKLNEVLRIAYNFAEDAIKILKFLVSVSDLKAVVMWCTLKEHFDLAEAFRKLPWRRSAKKPSIDLYQQTISGARNKAFHNLLAFDRTIEADLQGITVNARKLTLLRPHKGKETAAFEYEDREMVDILTDLTRAPETVVPFDFWKKNGAVMNAFERLLKATEDTLWLLNSLRK